MKRENIQFARSLRRKQTDAEAKLWQRLRAGQVPGFKFRRQHPVGPYIVDFVCLDAGLVVERMVRSTAANVTPFVTRSSSRTVFACRASGTMMYLSIRMS